MDQRTYNPLLTVLLLVALLVVMLVVAGPAGAAPNFTASDNDQRVTVGVGDQVFVTLRSDPSTGYTWTAVQEPGALLRHMGRAFQRTALGGQGTQTLSFVAAQPGVTTLRLLYARPQEGDSAPRQIFTLTVDVVHSWNDAGATAVRSRETTPGWLDAGAALVQPTTAGWLDAGASLVRPATTTGWVDAGASLVRPATIAGWRDAGASAQ